MKTEKYTRNPFVIDAVQVTDDNINEIAQWCSGDVRTAEIKPGKEDHYIKVRVQRPLNERQTQAFVGDWVLFAGTGYKVYTNKAFRKCFTKYEEDTTVGGQAKFPDDETAEKNEDVLADWVTSGLFSNVRVSNEDLADTYPNPKGE